ncbi:retron Ec67 family RNA-directed DNA polymerase/endonuclease [Mesorhizobium mediterraneum]|uniref:retron Ec67 family RNA-directed DNA polymerase/endonuclease n=1 Tax=Mesorhizobium mediterraneum TaxID=43617 RepID=UPI00177D9C95|nr:retron Ec67 family RNA-directed DNA polymerase/endonuclease [Mesorhizobium mediterraneum]
MNIVSLKLEQYRKATSLIDISHVLALEPAHISFALYKLDKPGFAPKYTEFSVAKKAGGERTIKAPHKALKAVQKRLAQDLLMIEQQLEATRVKRSDCILAHGFKKKLSIMTNGENHRHRRYVFNIDLKDFFPTINFGRVRGFFMKHKSFELQESVATILAQIACHNNQLPQGSPCSPVISNLIASVLDIRLNELAHQYNCTYTRYADDITFSTSEQNFPTAIGRRDVGSVNLWEAGPKLLKTIQRAGFELNPTKTRMQHSYSRQEVTGVVVNQKVNIAADYYDEVAAMCHHLFMDGECFIKISGAKQPFPIKKLRGRLAYIYQVRGKGPKVIQKGEDGESKGTQKFWASFNLFERFLNYADLYAVDRPLVLCEGVTDNIYIKSAIQALAVAYPTLTSPSGELKVKLFKYTKTSTAVQQLGGGSGELLKLITKYHLRTNKFKAGGKHPLIVIVDLDEGSKTIFKEVEKKTGKKIGTQPWFHWDKNLYIVPIPKVGGADTPIERLFPQALLEATYDGKTFDLTNSEKDGSKFFGKKVFATKVVAADKGAINFGGFAPLLAAIVEVIEHHKTKMSLPLAAAAAPVAAAAP